LAASFEVGSTEGKVSSFSWQLHRAIVKKDRRANLEIRVDFIGVVFKIKKRKDSGLV
jgi:hypothetical protein